MNCNLRIVFESEIYVLDCFIQDSKFLTIPSNSTGIGDTYLVDLLRKRHLDVKDNDGHENLCMFISQTTEIFFWRKVLLPVTCEGLWLVSVSKYSYFYLPSCPTYLVWIKLCLIILSEITCPFSFPSQLSMDDFRRIASRCNMIKESITWPTQMTTNVRRRMDIGRMEEDGNIDCLSPCFFLEQSNGGMLFIQSFISKLWGLLHRASKFSFWRTKL